MNNKRSLLAAIFASTAISASEHPNELKFSGILVRLDEASTKAPNGSNGHRILIPKALAERKVKTLIGMGVNYATDLDKHQPTRKVGVIKKAWIEGNAIKVSGVIWKKDFPDAEKDLKQRDLGMSFEASDIDVVDAKADIWTLSDLCFTGAAILYKASAAYFKTEALAASAAMSAQLITTNNGGAKMAKEVKKTKKTSVAASGEGKELTASALVAALTVANKPIIQALNALTASNVNLTNTVLEAQASEVEAKAKKGMKKGEDDSEDDDDDGDEDNDSDDDDMDSEGMDEEEASADDEDEIEDLDDEDDDADEEDEPGHLNKDVKPFPGDKGDKTTVSTKGDRNKSAKGATVKCGTDLSSLRRTVNELAAAREEDQETIKALNKQIKKQNRAIEAAGEKTDRRSVTISPGLTALLSKEGLDPINMSASGEKMRADEFDAIAAKSGLTINQRVAFKTEACRVGLMDEGHVRRATANA